MVYTKEDPKKGIEESYTPDWLDIIESEEKPFKKIPGVNEDQLEQGISIIT